MRFEWPWVLVALPLAVAAVVWVAQRGVRSVGPRQHRAAVAFRCTGVVLLVLALAQPSLVRAADTRSVLYLLDRSASITAAVRTAQEEWVAAALDSAGPLDRSAVAVFGSELRLDAALTSNPAFSGVRTVVDDSSTDLATALRAASAVLPTEGSRRIVVLTDAVETTGNARLAAQELGEQGVAVDVVPLATGRAADALISRVKTPVTARLGDRIPVEVDVRSTRSGPATLRVEAGDEVVEVPVQVEPGVTSVRVELPAAEPGLVRISARVTAAFDEVPENDRGEAIVRVLGAPRVLLVEGVSGEGDALESALGATGIEVDTSPVVPGADELLVYDGVMLVNVPAPPPETSADLAAYVEDLGRGLVVIGGDRSYGLGAYHESELENVLPVTSDPDDLIRRQPVAEVLVIDTSGSMADCHCDGIREHDASMQGGVNKTDISKAGAGLAIDALQPTDRIGVLAFTSGTRWAIPLGQKPADDVIDAALASLTPGGDTSISQALRTALDELKTAPEEIKHMVLFTDGWGEDPDLLEIAQEISREGITLSVLGTGEGTGDTLRRMAALGGGRFYPGRNLEEVPDIFVEETLRVARPLVSEGSFLPALGAASQATAGLTAAPPLRGYVLTKSQPTAQVALEIGPGDPLLASWQRGLGRVSAWTSDATARWSADWVTWEGYVGFWGRVVRDVLPAGLETPPEVAIADGVLSIAFEAPASLDAVAVATVRDATGEIRSLPLQRTGADSFAGTLPATVAGAYWVAVRVETPAGLVAGGSGGVVAGYPDEFAFRRADPALAGDIAAATGGRVDPAPNVAYEPAATRGAAARPLWPLLAAIALALFLGDVALRRLAVGKGDFEVWRETLRPTAGEPVAALETPSGDERASPPSREVHPEEETLGRLLRRKRT